MKVMLLTTIVAMALTATATAEANAHKPVHLRVIVHDCESVGTQRSANGDLARTQVRPHGHGDGTIPFEPEVITEPGESAAEEIIENVLEIFELGAAESPAASNETMPGFPDDRDDDDDDEGDDGNTDLREYALVDGGDDAAPERRVRDHKRAVMHHNENDSDDSE